MPIDTSQGTPTYVPSTMSYQQAYQTALGKDYSKKTRGDLSGTSAFALNYLQQQQQNAYDLELWNLANKYNSPVEQMKRYQEAGLNSNLVYGNMPQVSPASSSAPIPAKATNFEQENRIKKMNLAITAVNQLGDLMEGIQKVVDYATYGAKEHGLRNSLLAQQGEALGLSNTFKKYFQMPMFESRYTGKPVTVTFPDGSSQVWNYADSLEGLRTLAQTNQALKDTEVKDFLLNNIYPFQAAQLQTTGTHSQNQLQMYEKIIEDLHIESSLGKLLTWRIVSGMANFDPEKAMNDAKGTMMMLVPFL